jgi:uncharacterized protein (DUF305 family)
LTNRPRLAPFALLVAAALAGCTTEDTSGTPAPSAPVIEPGTPGGPNRTLSSVPATTAAVDPDDVTFLRDMMVHHQQAVLMSSLAPQRVRDAAIGRLAERIRVGQPAEIDAMRDMLVERGAQPPDLSHVQHTDHTAMAGMASPAQLAALRQARGQAFDRLFLQLMIRHHQGAVTMAKTVAEKGSDIRVQEVASDIAVTQTKEIATMRQLLLPE